jgi:hypothetical protein
MGENDAGRSGGLERPTTAEMSEAVTIPQSVTPEGLRARADIIRKAIGDESCARHLELAADEITKLRATGQAEKSPLEDKNLAGTSYQTEAYPKTRESRLVIYRGKKVIGFIVLDAEETYECGKEFIRAYDKIEGLE